MAIIEALTWIDQPLSPTQLVGLFEDHGYYLSLVSFHVRGLKKWGALDIVEARPVRGTCEKFFFFAEEHAHNESGTGRASVRKLVEA